MKKINGVLTALVTPFWSGEIDFSSLERLIDDQLRQDVDGFVVNGTTGESPCLEWDEVCALVRHVRNQAPAKKLVLGIGLNSTQKTLLRLSQAKGLEIDAVMAVVPYYNKPTQEGLFEHFRAIGAASDWPVILYNVPSRTVASLEPATILRLARERQIVGLKEATGDLDLARRLRLETPSGFSLLSGDDSTCLDFIRQGGDGVISVTSHIMGDAMKKLSTLEKAQVERDPELSSQARRFERLNELAFQQSSPIPIKAMLFLRGILRSPELRLPLLSLPQNAIESLANEMRKAGLL